MKKINSILVLVRAEIWKKVKNIFVGIITGLSDIVPGFSGGTLINVTGYMSKIIESWHIFIKFKIHSWRWWVNFLFGFFFVIGWAIGFFELSSYIAYFLDGDYKNNAFWSKFNGIPIVITWFFAFFVLTSVYSFSKIENIKILNYDGEKRNFKSAFNKKTFKNFTPILVGFSVLLSIGIYLVVVKHGLPEPTKHKGTASGDYVVSNLDYMKLCFAGFLSSFSLMLPGLSGSMILLLFGMYNNFFGHMIAHKWHYLGPLSLYMVSAVIGVILILTLFDKSNNKYSNIMRLFSLGMLLASWIVILMVTPFDLNPTGAGTWALTFLFIFIAGSFNYYIYYYYKRTSNKNKQKTLLMNDVEGIENDK